MRKLIPLLFALCFVQVFGQTLGFHRTNQVISRANSGVTANVVPYATVFVTYSATGATAAIYQDPGLSVPIPTGVVTADLNGNYGYYITTNYCVNESISAPGQGTLTVQNICQNGTGGSTLAISTNDVNNSSQTALNFLTSTTNSDGLTITPYNTGGGIEQFEITGVYNGNVPTATKLFSTGSNGTYWGVSGGVQQWIAPPGGGTVTSVGLTVPSWLTVSGSPITGSGTFGVTGTSEAQNLFLASPNGSSGALTPRAIVAADLPAAVVTSYPGAGVANSTGSGWGASYTSSNLIPANFISTLNQNTSGYAAGLAGGLLGSAPYQSAINTTLFIASPTTSGHTFFYGWQPSGSAIAPVALDLATYLLTPPAIGSTTANSGKFTSLVATSSITLTGGGILALQNGGLASNQYLSVNDARTYYGFDNTHSNGLMQSISTYGLGFAANCTGFPCSTYSGIFDTSGNFGVGTSNSAATSDNFFVTPAGAVTASTLSASSGYRFVPCIAQGTASSSNTHISLQGCGGAIGFTTGTTAGALPVNFAASTIVGFGISCQHIPSGTDSVTIVKQAVGAPTISNTTMTLNITTGYTVNTMLSTVANPVSLAAGDQWGLQISTSGSEVLANCGAVIVFN